MKHLNLETRFDSNLRDFAFCPEDHRQAIAELERQIATSDERAQISLLGNIGTSQRLLGLLDKAEKNFEKAISLSVAHDQIKFKLANLIRLGNTRHWMKKFENAHKIFDECLKMIEKESSLNEYLDFVYQHKGKCFFDENRFDRALEGFYSAILIRNNKSDCDLADSSLSAIEETKRRWLPQVTDEQVQKILKNQQVPSYVREVVGQRHGEGLPNARLNCINAALSFHGIERDRISPFKPIDLIEHLIAYTDQIYGLDDFQFGDLVVWWNRSGGAWDDRKIAIKDMNLDDSDFPYGLIFDHVAIRVTPDIVFNKPNPSPQAEYRFDFTETASYPSRLGKGHELTLHRVRPN